MAAAGDRYGASTADCAAVGNPLKLRGEKHAKRRGGVGQSRPWGQGRTSTCLSRRGVVLTLLVFEEFHLPEALERFLFRLIRPAQVFSLAREHFVSTRHLLDHESASLAAHFEITLADVNLGPPV